MSEANKTLSKEFPKALYSKGWEDLSAMVTVNSEEEEKAARKEGYKGLDEKPTAAEKAAAK